MKIAIYPNFERDIDGKYTKLVYNEILKQKSDPFVIFKNGQYLEDVNTITFSKSNEIDAIIAIGGDGTTLEAIQAVFKNNIPVLSINAGHLGFLCEVSTKDIKSEKDIKNIVKRLINKEYIIEKRLMLITNCDGINMQASNDIVVQRTNALHAIKIQVYINNVLSDEFKGDGVIVATPTGSTAYSLSCQGPVLSPKIQGFVINAICPHILHGRPMVVDDKCEIEIKAFSEEDIIVVACDGQVLTSNPKSSVDIKIKKSKYSYNKIKFEDDNNFYSTLLKKLNYHNK